MIDVGKQKDGVLLGLRNCHFIPCNNPFPRVKGVPTWIYERVQQGQILTMQFGRSLLRFVWIETYHGAHTAETKVRLQQASEEKNFYYPATAVVRTVEDDEPRWIMTISDSREGSKLLSFQPDALTARGMGQEVHVSFEICVSIPELVAELPRRFPKHVSKIHRLYDFDLRLVNQQDGGRRVELFIAWLSERDMSGICAFVLVDLVSRKNKVMKWVSVRDARNRSGLEEWIARLLSYRRAVYERFRVDFLNGCNAWSFLEKQRGGIFSTLRDIPLPPRSNDVTAVDCIDNSDVLEERPVLAFAHPLTPIEIRYSIKP